MISNENFPFRTYAVIEFDSGCPDEIKNWLNSKLKASKEKNGADLETLFSKNSKNQEIFLHLSADFNRFLKGAEEIGLKKRYKHEQTLSTFLVDDFKNFENSDNENEFLSQSERLKIIEYELNNLKHDLDEIKVGNVVIYRYDGIINQLKKQDLIKNVFPVHDKNELKRLESIWYKNLSSYGFFNVIPIEKIRDYFGETIAFYFRFFEFYTKSLYSFSLICLLTWILPLSSFKKFMISTVFNLIWNTIVMELWKRRSNELSYKWGLFDLELDFTQRAQFKGTPAINPVTQKMELYYPKKKRTMQKYFVSYPIIGISIFIAFLTMMFYYYLQMLADSNFKQDSYLHMIIRMLPSIFYSFIIIPLNLVYKYTSIYLTDWENHRTQTSYESNLTTKLFVFYFANSFMCLFYEAFFVRNYYNLSSLLVSMLIVNALVNKLLEVFAPYLNKKIKKKFLINRESDEIEKQAYSLDKYDGTYNDYVTLFEQYGYITLFSSIFPWVTLAALANNIMEQRSDAFTYCHVHQRPFPTNSQKGIGPWSTAFELIGIFSVMTNVALIALHPDVREYFSNLTDTQYVLYFVLIEHILIVIKIVIMIVIPNESSFITQAKQRYQFESSEALKKQV